MAVVENNYGKEDYLKLKYAFPGLDDVLLVLVWDFAQYMLQLQAGIEQWEAAKKN